MDTLRILITDDEPGMRMGAERVLRRFVVHVPDVNGDVAFRIGQAQTGEEALQIVREDPPDIVLLDHKLPGISGLEVLDELSGMKLDTLVVMITAYASIETAVTATKRGAYDFLAKPFTPDELKSTIRKAAIRLTLAKQARKLAEEKKQVRFQFIRVLGHELKAPLGAIQGYLDIIKRRMLGNDISAYQQMIERSMLRVEHMGKLVLDLLDMTRIESGQMRRELAQVDLRRLAETAIETMLPFAQARGITMHLHAGPHLAVTGDQTELMMILNNLTSNAVKYNRDGGRVDVTLTRTGDWVTITVADTGIGMTAKEAGKLFGEFVRIRNAQTKDVLGSGLGLSIVKKLARLYGGDATVVSEPDVGTTFTVTLKNQNVPTPQAAPAEKEISHA